MKKTAYIHIGMPKTGTTAIQKTLQRFFDEGKLDRFDMQFHHGDTWRLIHDFIATGDENNFIEQVHKTILKYSRKLGDKNLIFSNEIIMFWPENDLISRYDLLQLLATAFKDYNIKVVVYLRRQDLLMESVINQQVKGGFSTCCGVNISYKEMIDKCLECFGPESVIVRKYERENLYLNDAVTDFLQTVRLDKLIDDYMKHDKKSTNSSLSPRAFRMAIVDNKQYLLSESEIRTKVEELKEKYKNGAISTKEYSKLLYLYLSNRDLSRLTDESLSIRTKLLKGNSMFSVGSSNYGLLSPKERAEILARHAEDNAAVAREYFGCEDGKLFTDKVPTNIVDINSEPSTTDIVQTFMPILIDLTQRCERLEMSPLKRFMYDRREGVRKRLSNSFKLYTFARNVYKRFCK